MFALQKIVRIAIRRFFMNCYQAFFNELLRCIDLFSERKDWPSCCSHAYCCVVFLYRHTETCKSDDKVLFFCSRWWLFWGTEKFLKQHHVDVNTKFFVSGKNDVQFVFHISACSFSHYLTSWLIVNHTVLENAFFLSNLTLITNVPKEI